MNRRGFLKAILASGTAPYVVTTAGLLMPVRALGTAAGLHPFDGQIISIIGEEALDERYRKLWENVAAHAVNPPIVVTACGDIDVATSLALSEAAAKAAEALYKALRGPKA